MLKIGVLLPLSILEIEQHSHPSKAEGQGGCIRRAGAVPTRRAGVPVGQPVGQPTAHVGLPAALARLVLFLL